MGKNTKMLHLGLQTDRSLDEIEKALLPLGMNPFMKYKDGESGVYVMSASPISFEQKSINDYTIEELVSELENRDYDVEITKEEY